MPFSLKSAIQRHPSADFFIDFISRHLSIRGMLRGSQINTSPYKSALLVLMALILNGWFLSAAVKSTTGNIHFYPNYSGSSQATLNSNGFGLGTTAPSANLHVQGNAIICTQLTVGSSSGSSNLTINGTMSQSFTSTSSNITLTESNADSVILANSSAGNLRVSLPYAANVTGRILQIKQTTSLNEVYVTAHSGSNIDIKESLKLYQRGSAKIISHNGQWWNLSTQGNVENITDTANALYSDNLIGYWPLDGDGLDAKGSYHLTASANANSFVDGKRGKCAQFDHTQAQSLALDFSPSLSAPEELSLNFWVKGATGNWGNFVQVLRGSLNGSYIRVGRGGSGDAYWSDINGTDVSQTLSASEDFSGSTWQCVTFVAKNGQASKLFVNGSLKATLSTYTKGADALYGILLGARYGQNSGVRFTTSNLSGYLDDVRLYNKSLSDAEVLSLYQSF